MKGNTRMNKLKTLQIHKTLMISFAAEKKVFERGNHSDRLHVQKSLNSFTFSTSFLLIIHVLGLLFRVIECFPMGSRFVQLFMNFGNSSSSDSSAQVYNTEWKIIKYVHTYHSHDISEFGQIRKLTSCNNLPPSFSTTSKDNTGSYRNAILMAQ